MEKRYIEFIQDVLITIHENIHELNERKSFADPSELTHIGSQTYYIPGNTRHYPRKRRGVWVSEE
jgi:hypothetical protein